VSPVTVLGASGFIGSALVRRLAQTKVKYLAPARDEKLVGKQLGNVIYCVGLTADFRSRPFDAIEAHVCQLARILRDCDLESLTYLSSARVYRRNETLALEGNLLQINSSSPDDFYNISKIMGESLCLASCRTVRVVRLSNVYGDDFTSQNFLPTVIKEAITMGKVTVHNAPEAEKDYISIHDVVDGLLKIAVSARQNIYNLASGRNVSNQTLLQRISELTGCEVGFDPATARMSFPVISIERICSEFEFWPRCLLDDLDQLINSYRKHYARTKDAG
jgi:nucleoside-diphosphate-sugar epimerase